MYAYCYFIVLTYMSLFNFNRISGLMKHKKLISHISFVLNFMVFSIIYLN